MLVFFVLAFVSELGQAARNEFCRPDSTVDGKDVSSITIITFCLHRMLATFQSSSCNVDETTTSDIETKALQTEADLINQ